MLCTDKFIYIHQPKTGGTFVHDVLFQVYGISWRWYHGLFILLNKEVSLKSRQGIVLIGGSKHDTCKDAQKKLIDKRKFLSSIRNPLDQYVSQYEFGWWKRREWLKYYKKIPDFKNKFSRFPNLSFEEFMNLEYEAYNVYCREGFYGESCFGLQTMRFLNYYSKKPESVLKKMATGKWTTAEIKDTLYDVDFLRTHKLNKDLHDYLLTIGFNSSELEFILTKEKVLPLGRGRTNEQKWEKYYTSDLLDHVVKKDRLIFELFPEFLIN